MSHAHTVRFREVDAAGILYFARVFEICHDAFEDLLDDAGHALRTFFPPKEALLPIVHAEADYRRPLRLGDTVSVEVEVVDVGATSVTFGFRLCTADGTLCATARHVHACIDAASFTKRPVPEALIAALRAATERA